MNRLSLLGFSTLLCLSIAGCRGCAGDAPPADGQPAPAPAVEAGSPAAATASSVTESAKPVPIVFPPVVATVNAEQVTRADLERSIRGVETQVNEKMPDDKRDGVVRGVLERLINYRLLLQEAQARGIEVSPEEIDAQMTALARRFPNMEAMRQALIVRGVTIDMLRADARRDLPVAKLVAAETGQELKVPQADVRRFYDQNQDRFKQPEAARASHIFVRLPQDADDKVKHAMRVRAESIMRLAKRGDDFAGLARNYSEDRATGERGGDLGWFGRGTTPKPFHDGVFCLQAGRIGGLAETDDGFHVVKVHERREARVQPYAEVESDLATYLLRQLQEQLTLDLIKELRAKAKIEILF